jgi:hypothetical protein
VSEHSNRSEHGSLAGAQGLEPAAVMQITPVRGSPFRVAIARSGLDAVKAWAGRS